MFCRKCGSEIPKDSVFCPKCGEMISDEDYAAPKVDLNKPSDGNGETKSDEDFAAPKVDLNKPSDGNCPKCGKGLVMSMRTCIYCGAINPYYADLSDTGISTPPNPMLTERRPTTKQ